MNPYYFDVARRFSVDRRDFLRVAGRFGLSSTLMGAAALTAGTITVPRLASAA